MTISKKLGPCVALAALGSLIAVACSDSTSSPCIAACNHGLSCAIAGLIDAGYAAEDAGTFCQDACAPDGGGVYGMIFDTCKNPTAGYDCYTGLSCEDANSIDMGGGPALQVCRAKAECPGVTICTDSSECSGGAQCCWPFTNPIDGGLLPTGVCRAYVTGTEACLCTMASQCSTGCCAPFVSTTIDDAGNQQPGDPVGPYVCQLNNGFDYECCNVGQACRGTNYCCMKHPNGSNICVNQCTNDSPCGAAHCLNYVGPAPGSTCVGNMACGP